MVLLENLKLLSIVKNSCLFGLLILLMACGDAPEESEEIERFSNPIKVEEIENFSDPIKVEEIELVEDKNDMPEPVLIVKEAETEVVLEDLTDEELLIYLNSIETAAGAPMPQENYKVILSVDSNINRNESGRLNVWIGAEEVEVSFSERMTQDETTMPQSLGKFAKITPIAPDFDIEGEEPGRCYKIVPSGSEVVFILKPKRTGSYEVSAKIEIFDTPDCSGASVPKAAKTLNVTVKVDLKKEAGEKANTLLDVVWEKFLSFWGLLITFLFAVLLFVIKRKIKKKSGYKEEGDAEA